MAFVGANMASATTLCTNANGTACYAAGQKYDWSLKPGTTSRFTSGGSTIAACTASTIKGEARNGTATWIELNVIGLAWPGANCTTGIVPVGFGKLTIMWIAGNSATVEGDETEFTMELLGVSCTYGFGVGTHLGAITGGKEPNLSISTTVTKTAGSFLCPGTWAGMLITNSQNHTLCSRSTNKKRSQHREPPNAGTRGLRSLSVQLTTPEFPVTTVARNTTRRYQRRTKDKSHKTPKDSWPRRDCGAGPDGVQRSRHCFGDDTLHNSGQSRVRHDLHLWHGHRHDSEGECDEQNNIGRQHYRHMHQLDTQGQDHEHQCNMVVITIEN